MGGELRGNDFVRGNDTVGDHVPPVNHSSSTTNGKRGFMNQPVPSESPLNPPGYPAVPPSLKPDSPRSSPLLVVLLSILMVLIVVAIIQSLRGGRPGLTSSDFEPRPTTPRGDLAADEQSTVELFRQSASSVVYVTTTSLAIDRRYNVTEVPRGTGTGFVWDKKGHLVTNFHVIAGAQNFTVKLADQSVWQAAVVGGDEDRDIAVLRIDAPADRLTPILLGTSSDLLVGQKVFAIGYPFGLDQTLTTGIISGLGREIPSGEGRVIQGVIQTDAAINPGNSGGPLLDSAGRLIGVNTAIYSPTGTSAGIGFAIPIDLVNRSVPRIIRDGRIVRPILGIAMVPDNVVRQLGLSGVMIRYVAPNSPAARAGLRAGYQDPDGTVHVGDVIQRLDDRPIRQQDDLFAALEECQAGQTVKIVVLRGGTSGDEQLVELTLTF